MSTEIRKAIVCDGCGATLVTDKRDSRAARTVAARAGWMFTRPWTPPHVVYLDTCPGCVVKNMARASAGRAGREVAV